MKLSSSLGKGHSDLKMVILSLKVAKRASLEFADAQETVMRDIVRWSDSSQFGQTMVDSASRLAEVFKLWTEVQKGLAGTLREMRHDLKMILDGEEKLDKSRADCAKAEAKVQKLSKEQSRISRRAAKEATPEALPEQGQRLALLNDKLSQAVKDKLSAAATLEEATLEQEAVKVVRYQSCLDKWTSSYLDLSQKCHICFTAGRKIVSYFPAKPGEGDPHSISVANLAALETAKSQLKVVQTNLASPGAGNNTSTLMSPGQNNLRQLSRNPTYSTPAADTPWTVPGTREDLPPVIGSPAGRSSSPPCYASQGPRFKSTYNSEAEEERPPLYDDTA